MVNHRDSDISDSPEHSYSITLHPIHTRMFLTLRASSSRAPLQSSINTSSQVIRSCSPVSSVQGSRSFTKSTRHNLDESDRSFLSVTVPSKGKQTIDLKSSGGMRIDKTGVHTKSQSKTVPFGLSSSTGHDRSQRRRAHVASDSRRYAKEEVPVPVEVSPERDDNVVEESPPPEPLINGASTPLLA